MATVEQLDVKLEVVLEKLRDNEDAHKVIVEKLEKQEKDYLNLFRNGPISKLTTRVEILENNFGPIKWIGIVAGASVIGFGALELFKMAF